MLGQGMFKHLKKEDDMRKRWIRGESGMTLVEIMIVVILIGVVSVTLFSGIKKMAASAKIKTAKNQLKVIENALMLYESDHGSYPASLDELVGSEGEGGYLDEKQLKDPFGRPILYERTEDSYRLWSSGPNKVDDGGSKDDITLEEKKAE